MQIGIYAIKNKINNKHYVGQSENIMVRWKDHKQKLKSNKHANKYLQHSWNKYGKHNFEFIILEETLFKLLNEKEIFWCNKLESYYYQNGYNIKPAGSFLLSEESKRKISLSKKGKKSTFKNKKHSEKSKLKMSLSKKRKFLGELNPMYGKKHTQETKNKMSNSAKCKVGEKNNFYGKNHSNESKERMSKALTKHLLNDKQRNEIYKRYLLGESIVDIFKDFNHLSYSTFNRNLKKIIKEKETI